MTFKIGDRVRINNRYVHAHLRGQVGDIIDVNSTNHPSYCVQFKGLRGEGLHACGGRTPDRDGRWFYAEHLEHVGPPEFTVKVEYRTTDVDEATEVATKLAAILNAPVQVIHA